MIPGPCRRCGAPITRNRESIGQYLNRKYCGRPCSMADAAGMPICDVCGRRKPRGRRKQHVCQGAPGHPTPRLPIPDSARRVATWDGVPAVCWHCGGLWKDILGGRSCLQCGRDLYVGSALAAMGFAEVG